MRPEEIFSRDPEVMGGELVFAGTRVEVETLVDYLEAGHPLESFLDDFPTVGREQTVAFLGWALDAARRGAGREGGEPARLPADLEAVLERLARGIEGLYGARYKSLVLHGSYARGEAREESDVNLLVLLDGEVDRTEEVLRMEPVKWPLSLESGYVLSVVAVGSEEFRGSREPFLWNAREEGVVLHRRIHEELLERLEDVEALREADEALSGIERGEEPVPWESVRDKIGSEGMAEEDRQA